MTQDTQIVLPFASLRGKNLQADFDGGTPRLSEAGCESRNAVNANP
ncbi:MAG: hypothetical protein ETSY1_26265 [Candidatus Entotheonella factor]|uniref:Uncharacterized protein n=1 Tax=Entotheonella factor TaxID=1429438 RepID=W4LGR7_ENTF1|nr:hypothetical protein [Candidatus Entotheonella palauensis]ETW96536.1 MAG: hypothetical protein ETSY1_26265 [Candidatus Entotheonella factor]